MRNWSVPKEAYESLAKVELLPFAYHMDAIENCRTPLSIHGHLTRAMMAAAVSNYGNFAATARGTDHKKLYGGIFRISERNYHIPEMSTLGLQHILDLSNGEEGNYAIPRIIRLYTGWKVVADFKYADESNGSFFVDIYGDEVGRRHQLGARAQIDGSPALAVLKEKLVGLRDIITNNEPPSQSTRVRYAHARLHNLYLRPNTSGYVPKKKGSFVNLD